MRAHIVLALAGALALSACASAPPPPSKAQVTGSVIYRERILLPPPVVVTVTLADTSLMDAPAKVIATQVIEDKTAPPFDFALEYDPSKIVPNHTYSVSARIESGGQLRFITDTHTPVITNGAPTHVDMIAVGVPRN